MEIIITAVIVTILCIFFFFFGQISAIQPTFHSCDFECNAKFFRDYDWYDPMNTLKKTYENVEIERLRRENDRLRAWPAQCCQVEEKKIYAKSVKEQEIVDLLEKSFVPLEELRGKMGL